MPLLRLAPLAIAGLLLTAAGLHAEDTEHRELGPHVHGHGTLNIAFEGGRVTLELEAPGNDLLGFEHEAKSDADKATLEATTTRLKDALALFRFPAAAGCKVVEAKIDLDGEDSDKDTDGPAGGGAHDHADHNHADHDHADHDHGKHDHGPYETVDVQYELSCASMSAITSIDLGYFKAFPGARSLTVNVVTPRAQSAFEVTREKPVLDLGGLM